MNLVKLAAIGVAGALVVAGVLVAGSRQEPVVEITIKGYEPSVLEVVRGQKVVFDNTTQRPHTVTSRLPVEDPRQEGDQDKGGFDSGVIRPDGTWYHVFKREGTFDYYSKDDPGMTGKIIVRAAR